MSVKFTLCGDTCSPVKRSSYIFQSGPLHYRVIYYCGKLDEKTFAYVELILESIDFESNDPNLDYDRIWQIALRGNPAWSPCIGYGYGVSKGTSYAFRILANLAGIIREIIKKENPDEFRCLFLDSKHSYCWKKFFEYIARPTQAIREITVEPSRFHRGGEEWVISLNK